MASSKPTVVLLETVEMVPQVRQAATMPILVAAEAEVLELELAEAAAMECILKM